MNKSIVFKSTLSRERNCLCDMCIEGGRVIKIGIPETKFFNGKTPSTRYTETWICESCRDHLVKALSLNFNNPEGKP
jgi:hypothetical protein